MQPKNVWLQLRLIVYEKSFDAKFPQRFFMLVAANEKRMSD